MIDVHFAIILLLIGLFATIVFLLARVVYKLVWAIRHHQPQPWREGGELGLHTAEDSTDEDD